MATIVSMHAWKSWIIPIRENTTWIERSKSKLSNHRCGAMHKIRIQLYHFPPPPFVPHSAWTIPSEQSFTSVSIYPISISRRQSVAITPFWRIEPIRYAWKKKNNRDYLARDIPLLSRNDRFRNRVREWRSPIDWKPCCETIVLSFIGHIPRTGPAEHPRRISALWVRLSVGRANLRNSHIAICS